jgi:hypothetical protein
VRANDGTYGTGQSDPEASRVKGSADDLALGSGKATRFEKAQAKFINQDRQGHVTSLGFGELREGGRRVDTYP